MIGLKIKLAYINIDGQFGQFIFYYKSDNFSYLFINVIAPFFTVLVTSPLTKHLVKAWSIWSIVWSITGNKSNALFTCRLFRLDCNRNIQANL